MIQILINLLFNIRFNGVRNLDIFVDHFETQQFVQAPLLM